MTSWKAGIDNLTAYKGKRPFPSAHRDEIALVGYGGAAHQVQGKLQAVENRQVVVLDDERGLSEGIESRLVHMADFS